MPDASISGAMNFGALNFRAMTRHLRFSVAAAMLALTPPVALAADDAYHPPADPVYSNADTYQAPPPPTPESYEAYRPNGGAAAPPSNQGAYRQLDGSRRDGGYGDTYSPPPAEASREERYEPVPPPEQGGPPESGSSRGAYSQAEIVRAGHGFFGNVSSGLASAIEWAFQKAGRPNGYILGQDAGGAIVAGVRYGEGLLHTKDAGDHKVFWQGPSIGYDMGAEGNKVMVLVYNLRDPSDIYRRFGGVEGAAYLIGGVGVQLEKSDHVTLAPIRAGVGLRLGANVGYLKYTRQPTWNPF
jgi:hypothetical protein